MLPVRSEDRSLLLEMSLCEVEGTETLRTFRRSFEVLLPLTEITPLNVVEGRP